MADSITCICGYRGPSVAENGRNVCPICRTPAGGRAAVAPAAPPRPAGPAATALPRPAAAGAATAKHYRIACPNGHTLKVAPTMIGQQAVCPTCNAMFLLRLEDSREYRKEQDAIQEQKDAEAARKWLNRAIWAAVFIVASLAGMIIYQVVTRKAPRRPPPPPPEAPAVESTEPAAEPALEAPAEPVPETPTEPAAEPAAEAPTAPAE
jgi:hypothetical protein